MTRVALAHDFLAARAGGERVLLALAKAFPDAPIHSLIYEADATFAAFAGRHISTTWLNRFPVLRRHYRHTLPVAALTYAATKIDADVTICSSSGLSHHARTTGAKVVYCHTPARWLHDSAVYLKGYPAAVGIAARLAKPLFSPLDRRAMRDANLVIANSEHIAEEIQQVYGRTAPVVAPCSMLDLCGPVEPITGVEPGFVLTPARPLAYKRLDVLIAAARQLPDRQILHVGRGPHETTLRDAPANFTSLGTVSDAQLRWAYRNAGVVALTCAEDFGLVPLEAAAHGVHTVAPAARGLLDHDSAMLTSYDFASVAALVAAIASAPAPSGELDESRLGVGRFVDQIQHIVRDLQ